MPLFSIPLSGLTANSNALSVISNNLANLNTNGFKGEQASFRDLFYQTVGTTGGGNPVQIGNGVQVQAVSANFNDGSLNSTGVPTDLAITGDGFFVTEQNGLTQYTRAGNFTVNDAGQLTTQDGQFVLGYPAPNGVVNTSSGLGKIQLGKGLTSPPAPTANVALINTNLNAAVGIGANDLSTPVTVYDSLGTPHVLNFQFTKTAANTWGYQITLPAADTGGTAMAPVSGSLTFDTGGRLTNPASVPINITGLSDGAADLTVSWNLADSAGNPTITQVSAPSTTASTLQDGYSSGTLQSFIVDNSGTVQGTFSNGKVMALGQVAIATFSNNQGLERVGSNSFTPTLSSGAAVVGTPDSGGRGTISGGSLELSNVDVASEFAHMIIAQRGYEANAKVVTSFDQISQDTINLVR